MSRLRNTRKVAVSDKLKKTFSDLGADPTKALTRAYVFALGIIAMLTVSGHIISAHMTEKQKEGAEIAYHIGRQRTLLQQTLLYATNYQRMNEGLDYDFMMQSLAEMENGHQFLLDIIDKNWFLKGHTSPALYKIYHVPPFTLDEQVKDFSALVREFSSYSPHTTSIEDYDTKRKELIDKIQYKVTTILRPGMDAALEGYQTETLERVAMFYTLQLAGAFFILLVLLAEAVFIFRPLISKIRQYHTVLQRYALEDSLTGLNNRRAFMNAAETELKRAKRDQTAITVALLDIDHFKKVNDTYGHEVGDKVLQHFAGILKTSFRAGDITGRIGGEEFAIVLPRIDRKGAIAILQRLCDSVARTPCEYKGTGGVKGVLNYTISIGFTGPALIGDDTIDGLLAEADAGLYEAKRQGRNRVLPSDSVAESLQPPAPAASQ